MTRPIFWETNQNKRLLSTVIPCHNNLFFKHQSNYHWNNRIAICSLHVAFSADRSLTSFSKGSPWTCTTLAFVDTSWNDGYLWNLDNIQTNINSNPSLHQNISSQMIHPLLMRVWDLCIFQLLDWFPRQDQSFCQLFSTERKWRLNGGPIRTANKSALSWVICLLDYRCWSQTGIKLKTPNFTNSDEKLSKMFVPGDRDIIMRVKVSFWSLYHFSVHAENFSLENVFIGSPNLGVPWWIQWKFSWRKIDVSAVTIHNFQV